MTIRKGEGKGPWLSWRRWEMCWSRKGPILNPWKEWPLIMVRKRWLEGERHLTPEEAEELALWGRVVSRVEQAIETACDWREGEAFCRVHLRGEKAEVVGESLGVSGRTCRRLAERGRRKVESLLSLFGWKVRT